MMSEKRLHVNFSAGGFPRRILSIEILQNGDLQIYPSRASFFREIGKKCEFDSTINQQKYSVHKTSKSLNGNNFIKHGLIVDTKKVDYNNHVTQAIKVYNKIAYIYSHMLFDVTLDKYKELDSSNAIVLDNFNQEIFRLFVGVFVSCHKRRFINDRCNYAYKDEINIWQRRFGDFRISILWSYMPGIKDGIGTKQHGMTIPPEFIPDDLKNVIRSHEGLNEDGCLSIFHLGMNQMIKEHYELNKEAYDSVHPDVPYPWEIGPMRKGLNDYLFEKWSQLIIRKNHKNN